MIRALLVDDEPLAREGLRRLLEAEADLAIVGEAGDAPHAARCIVELLPDLVFLDVKMPGGDGFDALSRAAGRHLPLVVFVTAFDEHAVRAFEVKALDYLLKPVAPARLGEALARVRRELAAEEPGTARHRLVDSLDGGFSPASSGLLRRIVVRDAGRYFVVRTDDIEWISSAGNYVELHVSGGSHLHRATLTDLEARLDPGRFTRVHRTALVNMDRVRRIVPEWHGDCELEMASGAIVRMSRRYGRRVLDRRPAE